MGFWKNLGIFNFLTSKDPNEKMMSLYLVAPEEDTKINEFLINKRCNSENILYNTNNSICYRSTIKNQYVQNYRLVWRTLD